MSVQNEKLIEETRAGLAAFDAYWGAGAPVSPERGRPWELIRGLLSVFEKAHAHECEMCRWENGFGARKPLTHTCEKNLSTDDFPHGHPEMDPTDDEREALEEALEYLDTLNADRQIWYDDYRTLHDLISSALRRSEVSEPSADDAMSHYTDPADPFWQSHPEPQGESSDAQEVEFPFTHEGVTLEQDDGGIWVSDAGGSSYWISPRVLAALRAAGGVR